MTTLEEVERHWCLADVARINRVLDLKRLIEEEAERIAREKTK